jgi:hypothetical protein
MSVRQPMQRRTVAFEELVGGALIPVAQSANHR